ncbi:MAG: hypothetical protein DRP15_01580 [Candidatus Aenigmatarchaeota archaeon]|nr:MAG: hypothetical protein DRP15_01580 [Candidatus Aenigmarchaeota archaeon]
MIENIRLYTVFNSKLKPSIKVKVFTEHGEYSASVPSGTSKGSHEVCEISIKNALRVFPKIRKELIGMEENHEKIDRILTRLDGTKNFRKIGGNLALAISIAVARAQFKGKLWRLFGLRRTFPLPISNIIGGGKHGGGTSWQEFLVIPYMVKDPEDALRTLIEIWLTVGEELKSRKMLLGRNLENAWMSSMDDLKTLDFLSNIAEDWHVKLGIDFAASALWKNGRYRYRKGKKGISPENQLDLIIETAKKYKLYYLEDPLHENDFEGFAILRKSLKDRLIVGDDLYCTNLRRFEKGILNKSTNGIIVKPNQSGTLWHANRIIELSEKHSIITIASHRSGETEDNWISDLAVAWKSPFIKISVLGYDISKHNRLIELWEDIPEPKMADLPL